MTSEMELYPKICLIHRLIMARMEYKVASISGINATSMYLYAFGKQPNGNSISMCPNNRHFPTTYSMFFSPGF